MLSASSETDSLYVPSLLVEEAGATADATNITTAVPGNDEWSRGDRWHIKGARKEREKSGIATATAHLSWGVTIF